jgi:hypothetical protein
LNGPISLNYAPNAAAPLDFDLACFHCRYSLRTIDWDSVCPECGTPVRQTATRGWLQFAKPQWLRKLRWGVDLTIISVILTMVGVIAISIYIFAEFIAKQRQPQPIEFSGVNILASVVYYAAILAITLLLTAPEDTGEGGQPVRRTTLGRWIVGLTIGGMVTGMLLALFVHQPTTPEEVFDRSYLMTVPILMLSAASTYVSWFLIIIHVRRIARRDMAGGLVKMMSFILWGGVALVGVGLIVAVLVGISLAVSAPQMLAAMSTTAPTTSSGPALPAWLAAATSQPNSNMTNFQINSSGQLVVTTQAFGGGTATPGAPPPLPPVVRGMMASVCPLLVGECFAFIWMICVVVAVFWLRIVLSRAINDNLNHLIPARA